MTQAAFFDLDKTVIAKSSTLAFTGKLYKAGMLGRRTLVRAAIGQLIYVLFGADHDTLKKARDTMMSLTKGWNRAEIEQIVEETLEDVVAPLVYAEALFLIDEHLREGRRVFIISASPEEIVRPLARYIGVDEVIATRAKVDEADCYTGEIEFYAYAQQKADEVRRLAEDEGIDLDRSYAYSDSATDIPLLAEVGHPHAVNPDKELREAAEERDWPILEFQRQVSLGSRLAKPVPIISGATVATIVGTAIAWALLRKRK
ncbi:MAG TPA: HAD-IB family hydrolase [Acidimicrobiia bacterium]|nr:HAD-IB family hydrolase [Acidimicrobiia bacterium]